MTTTDAVGITPPGYKLPDSTRLGRVRLQIADLARSLSFYQDVLGLRVLDHAADRATLGAVEDDLAIVDLVERPGARSVPRRGLLGLFHVAFLLPERGDLARFVRHVAETGVPVGMSDHLVSEAIYLYDPDGLGIEVYADRPRASWRMVDRQIEMATKPLDTQRLLELAGTSAWSGAPSGMRVGHVHLHVGDIDEASSFYHEALGFSKVVWNYPGALFMSAGGYHHHLGTNTWAAGMRVANEEDAKLLNWTLVVPSEDQVSAAARSLIEAGYAASRDQDGWMTADPWGTALRICAND